jgi:response regulator RpfG family c-di-GMP phosphodiesterase
MTGAARSADAVGRDRVLVVDDEATIRDALQRFLVAQGYDVVSAGSASEALAHLRGGRFAAMLCDVRMPGTNGVDLVPDARRLDGDVAILMLTAVNDAATATEALTLGAVDYLLKPIELTDLAAALDRALARRAETIERRSVESLVREEVALRTRELEREKLGLRAAMIAVLDEVVHAAEAKDPHRAGHSRRVAALAREIALALGLDAATVDQVRVAGLLHDVGALALSDTLWVKHGALTAAEYADVKSHIERGLALLAPVRHLGPVLDFIRDHHEAWDGTGYPRGLRGEAISIGGRVLAAADAYVALTAGRAYKPARAPDDAYRYLAQSRGTTLDPQVYDALAVARHTLPAAG